MKIQKKGIIWAVLLILINTNNSLAQVMNDVEYAGKKMNLDISTGFQGSLSFGQVGINLPQFIDNFVVGFKFRGMSSTNWTTFIHEETKQSVSFHPVVMAGVITLGGTNQFAGDAFRVFGNCELLVGYTFTPYDNMVYKCGNLVGDNITLGFFGTFGLEYFSSKISSVYIESGGGLKTIKGDKDSQYVIAAAWQGSGATIRMGTRIYLGTKKLKKI